MRTVASPSCLATGAISRSNTSPSASGTTSGAAASGRPAASVGKTSVVRVLGVCLLMSGSLGDWLGTNLLDCRGLCASRSLRACGDSSGEELGVVLDPADEGRAARVLPRETEEVEARNLGHASSVARLPALIEHRKPDPRVVGAVSGRPDHAVDVELTAIGEADSATRGADRPLLQNDAVTPNLACVRADERVAMAGSAADARVNSLLHHPSLR